MTEIEQADAPSPAPKWKPISAIERRILGVLAEKAKTTPDQYPLSLNALTNGCNQKSNRSPQMNLEPIQVEDALQKLRAKGAVSEVQGGGRVAKFKHYIYEWLGVNKVESAVMIELLLRGVQTIGELRGRAARMEPIDGVSELKPIVEGLIQRGLVISLTSEGRGQAVTHALYLDQELDKVRREFADQASAAPTPAARASPPTTAPAPEVSSSAIRTESPPVTARADERSQANVNELRGEVQQLRDEVAKLRSEIEDIWSNLR